MSEPGARESHNASLPGSPEPAGRVIWITGPPACGKTTLARLLVGALRARGVATLWLDSDDLRPVLVPGITAGSYTREGRDEFYGALAHIARLGAEGGAAVVISATGSRRAYRDAVRAAALRFTEIELRCEEEILRRRDVKGLYRRAGTGEITDLPGAGATYELPEHAEIVLESGALTPEQMLESVLRKLGISGGP